VWPRTYGTIPVVRGFFALVAGVALAGALGCAAALLFAPRSAAGGNAFLAIAFALAAAFALYKREHDRVVVLSEDEIEFVELGARRRRLRRDEIAGRRVSGGFLVLVLRDARRKRTREYWMNPKWEGDEAFSAWFDTLPPLDARGRS
jgi:heme-degrading monooxygenase HmoA